ncbi:MAG TPA: ABC transporter permease [Bacteroidales bacterium]|nr:ABC transporter permease [Bacteroidales bacterium]
MIRIFFKTLWNNRKRNILVFIELLMISLVMFNLTLYLVNMITVYRIKNCYNTDNVVLINITKKADEDKSKTDQAFENLKKVLSSDPYVESVSISTTALPYNYNLWSSDYTYGEQHFNLAGRRVDFDYAKVMKIKPIKGRWFDETDIGKTVKPVIISKGADEKYFDGNSIGKTIDDGNNKFEIIGVVDEFKRSDIEKPIDFAFFLSPTVNPQYYWAVSFLVRTKEGAAGKMLEQAEGQVYSTLDPEKWTISNLNSLDNMRASQNADSSQRNYLSIIIALFIMVNVFLGTIGILWYNTNLRINEIGIKRAVGSTGSDIRRMLILESMVIAILALLIVMLIIMQVPTFLPGGALEKGVYGKSVWISSISMVILVLLSTWIPAAIASNIRPATALKTE